MATEGTLTPSEYITHHLTFNTKAIGEGAFWSINIDSLVMGVLLGIISMALIWMVARKATAGVPSKGQAFVELMFGFIDDQVKNIFHGDRHAFIAPAALTVFIWVLVMNSMDFLPIDVMAHFIYAPLGIHEWRSVPTSDINTTFALAIAVWILMIYFGIKVKGFVVGFMNCLQPLMVAKFGYGLQTFYFNIIEYISKPFSLSPTFRKYVRRGSNFLTTRLTSFNECDRRIFWSIIGRRLVHIPYSNCGATSICLHDVNGGVFIDGA
jgi:F-type H+-transporting ATPase subunit a